MSTALRFSLILLAFVSSYLASAHDARLAHLSIHDDVEGRAVVVWKCPIIDGRAVDKHISFDEGLDAENQGTQRTSSLLITTYLVSMQGQDNFEIFFTGDERDRLAVSVNDRESRMMLEANREVYRSESNWDWKSVSWFYLLLGVDHILFGIDHLLFVFALLFVATKARDLFWTITAFTLAHSITLTLAATDLYRIPIPPVEAIIALSIVFLSVEVIKHKSSRPGLTFRRPWIIAFAFGLLHGFGFASALSETGLPKEWVALALASFNVGVELGQIIFVLFLLGAYALIKPLVARRAKQLKVGALYLVGGIAAFWFVERIVGML